MAYLSALLFALLIAGVNSLPPQDQSLQNRQTTSGSKCKCYEGESCWPSATAWNTLNATVDGYLQKVVPAGAVCYNTFEGKNTYNSSACSIATANWNQQSFHPKQEDPVYAMNPLYTNGACLPTTNKAATCSPGFLADYVIMAKTKQHIAAGVKFAREYNLPYGALAINTHSFQDIKFTKQYAGPGAYTGSAVTVGAGIQSREMYTAAFNQNPKVNIVGGECATVGFAGGYIQGGGHGPLTSLYGMAADQALEFEVVTAKGEFVTANADINPDLFWALRGGGPATFAIVTSLTVKTFPEVPSAMVILNINSTHTTNTALWWQAVTLFHSLSNHYVDNDLFVYYELTPGTLHIQPFVGPNMNSAKLAQILKPLYDGLTKLGIRYTAVVKEYPTFFQLYMDILSPPELGFGVIIGHIVGPGNALPVFDNAVHSGWRNASSFSIASLFPTQQQWATAKKVMTEKLTPAMTKASPRGGAYVNECDLGQPDWQNQFWGTNYPKLLEIRKKWDGDGIFYAQITVGTEDWAEVGNPPKLCKK
ncbi:isoamyl alcohol oxidase [Leptodontidium sp. MPI-SDFR-AT-0119]|nr:isoamyl alcohol oxidase [Leptodontidium sp. MPI-SDFR-AT-0119]